MCRGRRAWADRHRPELRAQEDSLRRSARGFKGGRRSPPLLNGDEFEAARKKALSEVR